MFSAFSLEITAVLEQVSQQRSHASLQDNRLSNRVLRNAPQRIFSTIFKYQLNSTREILSTFFDCTALAVSAWYFRAICDEPLIVLLYDRGEFIVHKTSCFFLLLV